MRTLVVTRPKDQAQALVQQLASLGNRVLPIPLLHINAISASIPDNSASWIFISINAVNNTFSNASDTSWQKIISGPVYAIGQATKEQLIQHGASNVITPLVSTSEALLKLKALQAPLNQRIIIACGRGGRRLIEQELASRKASVERYECYQRISCNSSVFRKLWNTHQLQADALWILSSEQAMMTLNDQLSKPVECVVTSNRLDDIATELTNINVAAISKSAQSNDIVRCIELLNNKAAK